MKVAEEAQHVGMSVDEYRIIGLVRNSGYVNFTKQTNKIEYWFEVVTVKLYKIKPKMRLDLDFSAKLVGNATIVQIFLEQNLADAEYSLIR